jgi:eukaryotic-like serine/threonine-protein kinase
VEELTGLRDQMRSAVAVCHTAKARLLAQAFPHNHWRKRASARCGAGLATCVVVMPKRQRPPAPAQLPLVLEEKYRVQRVLGQGGMGVVYHAIHRELEHPVAIKIMHQDLAINPNLVQRMLHEARTVAKLRSEHVARVLDVGRLPTGAPYIVMEYLDGSDLATLITEHGTLPVKTAVQNVLQCCEAVAEAHAEGVIHRDIKPENLFRTLHADGTPSIKVLDFGIAKHLEGPRKKALTTPNTVVGSPNYMSPEQMRADGVVDTRTDIWSLGVVLYELLTGHTPFEASSLTKVCARVLHDDPIPPRDYEPEIPAELEYVIMSCLEKRASDRIANVADLACALAPFAGAEGVLLSDRVVRVASSMRKSFHALAPIEEVEAVVARAMAPEVAVTRRIMVPQPQHESISTDFARLAIHGRPSRSRWLGVMGALAATFGLAAWVEPWSGLANAADAQSSLVTSEPVKTRVSADDNWAPPPAPPPGVEASAEPAKTAKPVREAKAPPVNRNWKQAAAITVAARPTTVAPVKDPRSVDESASEPRQPPPPLPSDDDTNPL